MIFILGIDALDYELVNKFNLNNLKQLEFSKIIVPINELQGIPMSPEVWMSFLVGRHIPMDLNTKKSGSIHKILDIFDIDPYKGFGKKLKDLMIKLGFFSYFQFKGLKQKTFLDITKSKEINVPYYSFDHKTFHISFLFGHDKISIKQAIKEIKLIYENRKIQILKELGNIENNDVDVVFAFIHTLDILQHLSFLHISEIKKQYLDLDTYVSILKRKLEDYFKDVIFIIISDHGFDFNIGNHSKYAFFSSNVNFIPKPEKITDFYGIILDITNNRELI